MKALNVKDQKNRFKNVQLNIKKKYLKSLKSNSTISQRFCSKSILSTFLLIKKRNRCIVTGRGRAILKDFKLSRLEFSRIAKRLNLPGVKKASW